MIWFGLTGGIGSGKSTVMDLLEAQGVHTRDADILAKKLLQTDPELINNICREFGTECYETGHLQTKILAQKAFKDSISQQKLNDLVHPALKKYLLRQMAETAHKEGFMVVEAALLLEAGSQNMYKGVILVTADKEIRLSRAMQRNLQSKEQILSRMALQMPEAEKAELADHIIVNNGNNEELAKKVQTCLAWMEAQAFLLKK